MKLSSEDIKSCPILIVDDEPKNIQLLGNILNEKGYQVEFATNGEEALDWIETRQFDLVLLDIMMPGIDGIQVCQQLKKNQTTSDIPIIFITAKAETDSVVQGFEAGAVDYITKPFQREELLSRVHTHLSLRISQKKIAIESKKRKELLQILCHDLGNQVSGAIGVWQMIEIDQSSWDKYSPLMSISLKNALSMIELVHEMRSLEDEKVQLKIEESCLKDLISDSHQILINKFKSKNICLDVKIDDSISVKVEPVSFVSSVLNNIFTNAIKFSPKGASIKVNATQKESKVELSIRDYGIGMPSELIEDLFDENKKTNRPGTEGETGTGYGMPLVKKFVEAYGGTIQVKSWSVESNPKDHGTEIFVSLDK